MRFRQALLAAFAVWIVAAATAAAATPEEFIDSAFPYIAGEGGAPALPAGTKASSDRPGHRYLKVPASGGGTAHLFATGPFAFEEGGQVRTVNTDLIAAGDGWQPQSVPFDVVIPQDLADGILWRDAETGDAVRIYPQNINNAPGRLYAGSTDTVVYDDVWNRTYMTVAVTTHGVKDHIILTQAHGVPTQFKFRVDRPAGATTSLTSAGAVQVVSAGGAVLAELPAPVARDRDHQEFAIWYEVESHGSFDVIVLKYDTSPITAEGATVTFEPPFDLDPTIYSGSLVHGENAFRETSLNAYTVSDFNDGNLRSSLLKWDDGYPAGKFARWWITAPPAGSRWYLFSARVEGRVGQGQHYSLKDDAATRYEFGPAAAPGTYFAQDVSFTPQGHINHRIEATQAITPQYDYYGQLTNPVVVYEDLVDPTLTDLRPNNTTVSASQVTLNLAMSDGQSGCGSITATLHGPVAPIGTKTGSGCSFAPVFDLRTEGTHRIDVVLTDRSGRTTNASATFSFDSPVDPPLPPVVDGLDFGSDQAWTHNNNTFSASWNTATGATSYQLCFTTSAPCAADDRWSGFGGATSGTVGGYAFADGQTVFACVRSVNAEGVRTVSRCSDGIGVDMSAPAGPAAVYDGFVLGADSDATLSTFESAASWPAAVDSGSGVTGYESCLVPVGSVCPEDRWYERDPVEALGGLSTLETFKLELGAVYRVCIRAYDVVDNTSPAVCSDGQAVTPSEDEIETNVLARIELGLPYEPDFVRSLMKSPPSDGVIDSYGFTATQQEAAYLATTFAVQDALTERLDDLAITAPRTFGGMYIDTDSGKMVLNLARPNPKLVASVMPGARAACRNATVRTRRLRSRANRGNKSVRGFRCDSSLVLRRVRYTERVLSVIRDRVFDEDAAALRKKGVVVNLASINTVTNRLELEIDPTNSLTPAAAERLLNHFYTRFRRDRSGPIRVTREAEPQAPTARRARPNRDNVYRSRGFVAGGMRVHWGPSVCTSGFAFPNVSGLMTAHHCINGMATNTPTRESWVGGLRIGRAGGSHYVGRRLDIALTRLDDGVASRLAVYRRYPALPANHPGPVLDFFNVQSGRAGRVVPGGWICRSANSDDTFGRDAQSCTRVRAVNVGYRIEGYGEGVFIGDQMRSTPFSSGPPYNVVRGGRLTTCEGDSGGPTYRVVNYTTVRPVGISSTARGSWVPNLHPRYSGGARCTRSIMTYAPIAVGQ